MTDWTAIVSTYESLLWRTAFRVLNHRDDALDCCQQALLDAYGYARTHDVDDWRALLMSLTTRRAIDRLRQRRHALQAVIALDDVAELAANIACPEEQAIASELMDGLRDALTELPNKQAEVFWLSCVEHFTHDEISQQLAISRNESHVLLHRARLRLASLLNVKPFLARRSP